MAGARAVAARRWGRLLGGDRRRRAGRRPDRGAVAVETALVTPVLLVVLLGIIELPMLIRDYVAVTSAARSGVRVGSAAPAREAPSASAFVQLAADAVARSASGLPDGALRYVLVYEANDDGYPGSGTTMPDSCAGVSRCVMLTWDEAAGGFTYASGSWASATVNACFPNDVDAVGVQVVADHSFLSGLIGTSMTMSDHAVMNFEPLPPGKCAEGSHA